MIGCWLNVWLPSLSDLLQKTVWRPLPIYLAASVIVTIPMLRPEWSVPALTFIRNLSGMLLLARICYRIVASRPSTDWRALAKPVFFVFAFHGIVARILTKVSAQWIVEHHIGSAGFFATHLLNATLTIGVSLLAFYTLKRLAPPFCNVLNGTFKPSSKKK